MDVLDVKTVNLNFAFVARIVKSLQKLDNRRLSATRWSNYCRRLTSFYLKSRVSEHWFVFWWGSWVFECNILKIDRGTACKSLNWLGAISNFRHSFNHIEYEHTQSSSGYYRLDVL